MNSPSINLTEGSNGATAGDPFDFQQTRLWDQARSNLLLLYGGRRRGVSPSQVVVSNSGTGIFGNVDLKI